ncbi:MAG: TrmH family RNA methyltransferase, partial [Flavobacteriales bacterium]
MISGEKTKLIRSLRHKKHRGKNGLFVVEGSKMVRELLASSFTVEAIYSTGSVELEGAVCEVSRISHREMSKISGFFTPSSMLAVANIPQGTAGELDLTGDLQLALDSISDPGNMGSIIRLADWFGIRQLFCSETTVDAFNPKVVQSSMGSLFRVAVHYCDLSVLLEKAGRDCEIYAATMEGTSLYATTFSAPALILLGSESHGIATGLQKQAQHRITIPRGGQAESLNVALAASAIVSEFRRQR